MNEVQTVGILSTALKLEIAQQTKGAEMRVSRILKQNGWKPERKTIQGIRIRVWTYCPLGGTAGTTSGQPQDERLSRSESLSEHDFEASRDNLDNLNPQNFSPVSTQIQTPPPKNNSPQIKVLEEKVGQVGQRPLKASEGKGYGAGQPLKKGCPEVGQVVRWDGLEYILRSVEGAEAAIAPASEASTPLSNCMKVPVEELTHG
jgi:hypothetical protein